MEKNSKWFRPILSKKPSLPAIALKDISPLTRLLSIVCSIHLAYSQGDLNCQLPNELCLAYQLEQRS